MLSSLERLTSAEMAAQNPLIQADHHITGFIGALLGPVCVLQP